MKKERKLIFLSFFFILSFSHAEDAFIKQNTNSLKVCSENNELISFVQVVNTSFENWDKQFINDIQSKAVILFYTNDKYILFSNRLNSESLILEKIRKNTSIKIICQSQKNNDIPYIVFNRDNQIKFENDRLFYFIYRTNKFNNEINSLSQFFEKILLINATKSDHVINNEIELTIAHESLHLFSQDDIFDSIPPSRLENILIIEHDGENQNTQLIDLKNEACNQEIKGIRTFSNREYLDFKYRCLPKFKELIQKETCLDQELIKTISQKHDDTNGSKLQAIIILKELFKIMRQKNDLYKDNNLALEWYWYLAEGVPQYFEQKLLLQRKSTRVISNYENHCQPNNDANEMFFYPLLTGSAIWHGLEFIHDSETEWGHFAEQSIENVPDRSTSDEWIDNWLLMLDKQLTRINLN